MDYHLLIHKFLTGEISGEETAEFYQWLYNKPENQELFNETKLIWDNAPVSEAGLYYDPEEELHAIQSRIEQSSGSSHDGQTSGLSKRKRSAILKIAAITLLLTTFNFLGWFLTRPSETTAIEITNGHHHNEISLPDGSRVYLNKNTSFSFEQSSGKREAHLEGEAYFEVSEDQDKPFFLYLHNASIKVLGTTFNVNAYPQRDSVEVVVTSGKVEFYNKPQSVKLDPGERAVLHATRQGILKTAITNPNFDAWRTGKLQFDNTGLGNILAILEGHYDISFKVKDDRLLTCRFTGIFEDDSLEKVLEVLSFGLDFEYQSVKGQYILSGKGCEKKQ